MALIRIVNGEASVHSGSSKEGRLAEPLTLVRAGEIIVVARGSVVFVDLESSREQTLGAGSSFVMPQRAASPPSLYEAIAEVLSRVAREPDQRRDGASRSEEHPVRTWPDGTSFAPGAYVVLRWSPDTPAKQLVIDTPNGRSRKFENAESPFTWPRGISLVPGRFRWHVENKAGQTFAVGLFDVLTKDTAMQMRESYEKIAKEKFPSEYLELSTELVAAADNCFLH